MNTEIETRPEEKEARILVAKATILENEARAIAIIDNETYESAAAFKQAIRNKRDEIMAKPTQKKADAHGVWKYLSEICNMIVRPFDQAEAIVDRKMIDYRTEVERKRQAEAQKAREKAEAEARKKRDAEIARAKELKDKEAVRNLKAAPLEVKATAPKTPEAPKVAGMPVRKIWKYQVDVTQLDRKYMIPNDAAIGKIVRALGAAHGISGVTAFQEEVL
jgi:hypothetical protein